MHSPRGAANLIPTARSEKKLPLQTAANEDIDLGDGKTQTICWTWGQRSTHSNLLMFLFMSHGHVQPLHFNHLPNDQESLINKAAKHF